MPNNNKRQLSVKQAKKRVRKAVQYLEKEINRIDGTPGKRDKARHKRLSATLMTALAEENTIVPPK